MPHPVSVTSITTAPAASPSRATTATRPPDSVCAQAVLDQVSRRPLQQYPVRAQGRRRLALHRQLDPRLRRGRLVELADHPHLRARVQRLAVHLRRRIVRPRQEQQAVDDPAEAITLLERRRRSRCRYSSAVRGRCSVTSACTRRLFTGVRSSWAMSAENRDNRPNASSSRSQHAVERSPRAFAISAGTPPRRTAGSSVADPIRLAAAAHRRDRPQPPPRDHVPHHRADHRRTPRATNTAAAGTPAAGATARTSRTPPGACMTAPRRRRPLHRTTSARNGLPDRVYERRPRGDVRRSARPANASTESSGAICDDSTTVTPAGVEHPAHTRAYWPVTHPSSTSSCSSRCRRAVRAGAASRLDLARQELVVVAVQALATSPR